MVRTDRDLYPIVGIRSFDGLVRVNFGQQPFVYDVTDDLKRLPIQRQSNKWKSLIENCGDVLPIPPVGRNLEASEIFRAFQVI